MSKLPKALNEAEETFALHCKTRKLEPQREFIFCPGRKWKFDFCFPLLRLAIELEGGVHRIKGRFAGDVEKYNKATLMGWKLLRYTKEMVIAGTAIDEVEWMVRNLKDGLK